MDEELPLLLNKEAMKKAGMMIDFTNDSAQIFGFHINLEITSSGHYIIPLSGFYLGFSVWGGEVDPKKIFGAMQRCEKMF